MSKKMTRHTAITLAILGSALAGACTKDSAPSAATNSQTGAHEVQDASGGSTASGGEQSISSGGGENSSGGAEVSGGQVGTDAGVGTSLATGPQPYANVVAVRATGSAGAYSFMVSVESSDVDCTQFCNWWEVLTEDGSLIYRRILEHSHTDANGTSDVNAPGNTFSREGGPVAIAAGQVVVVRAHMKPGGYRGQVMRGSVNAGFAVAADIDSDFAADVEDDNPQSTSCQF